MRAMTLPRAGAPLEVMERPVPEPGPHDLLIKVHACGVCRTDLHIVDGDLTGAAYPITPGHEVVGTVVDQGVKVGAEVERLLGRKVGVPWLGWTCGRCRFCVSGRENLCETARFTGYQIAGGYAEYLVADARYVFPLPDTYGNAADAAARDAEAAPLLCAGLIGYRSLRQAGDARRLGLYGFGASAHIVLQVARYEGRQVFAFTRPGDVEAQALARELGADWAGDSESSPPEALDAAIIFAPAGQLVPRALAELDKGGAIVCAGIHMTDIPAFRYELLWGERSIRSVANLTRRDGEEFLALAPRIPVRTVVETHRLTDANAALDRLRSGQVHGAAVLLP
jgi:propanol-preferring alcohol dehydrogenase